MSPKILSFLLILQSLAVALSTYSVVCDTAFCRVLDESLQEISSLKNTIDAGTFVPNFGQSADLICNSALERFSQEAALPDDNKINEELFDKKFSDLEKMVDAPLHVLYLKQLSILREKALKTFKSSLVQEGSEYEAMMLADEMFRREAEESTRQTPDWDFAREMQTLKSAMTEIASRAKKIQEVKLNAAKQNNQAMQVLQMQQQQLAAIQQQISGSSSPWNVGMAYRVPDSSINLSCSYQQGRGSVQLSCVPDEAVPLLGPNGFVNGVTPGNVGLSFNINI